jgi:hypothetical protein
MRLGPLMVQDLGIHSIQLVARSIVSNGSMWSITGRALYD